MLSGARYLAALALVLAACASAKSDDDVIDGGGNGDSAVNIPDAISWPDRPAGTEVCNGQDDDGDQFVDEGAATDLCDPIMNGTPRCNGALGCVVDSCDDGFFDLDGDYANGCECTPEATETAVDDCANAVDLGNFADSSTSMEVVGNIVDENDTDYYRFYANDSADSSCDTFHARALLIDNPGDEFVIDVWRGGCTGAQVCDSGTDMQWYTNFSSGGVGECPCGPTSTNHCGSVSAEFIVRVRRKAGRPLSCNSYRLEISNGKYPAP